VAFQYSDQTADDFSFGAYGDEKKVAGLAVLDDFAKSAGNPGLIELEGIEPGQSVHLPGGFDEARDIV